MSGRVVPSVYHTVVGIRDAVSVRDLGKPSVLDHVVWYVFASVLAGFYAFHFLILAFFGAGIIGQLSWRSCETGF